MAKNKHSKWECIVTDKNGYNLTVDGEGWYPLPEDCHSRAMIQSAKYAHASLGAWLKKNACAYQDEGK
jgi:hypothetical protein